MFLSLNALGGDSANTSAIPPKKQRTTVKFMGNSQLDSANAQNIELTDEQIKSINSSQSWSMTTIFNADFQSTLEAGNLINQGLPITHWRIYRRAENESLFSLLAEIPYDKFDSSYIDYKAANKIEYYYEVRAVSNGTEGSPIVGVSMADFYGWVLTSEDGATSFTFDLNLKTDNIKVIQDYKKLENNTPFPVFSFSPREYEESKITAIPYELNGDQIEVSLNVLETLKAFINNKKPKILKNQKGQNWLVMTTEFDYQYMDDIQEQPFSISFQWTQIGVGV